MLKRQNIVLNMVILVLALCVVFFACIPVNSYAEDDSSYGTVVRTGFANPDKGVKWTQYQDGSEYTLVFELTGTGSSDKEKAITTLLDENASSFVRDTLAKNTTKIVIKEGVTGIGWKAIRNNDNEPKYDSSYYTDDTSNTETDVFNSFTKLKEVEPCSTIKRIGWSAFRKCSNLESFDFSKCTDLEEIMNQAFNPSGLKEAGLSGCSKLKTIRTSAFNSITTLESATLPGGLEIIGKTAFANCTKLETLTFEEGSEPKLVIWGNAFSNIGVTSLTIPDSVKSIRRYGFEKCANLETATFADTSVTELWQYAFSNSSKLDEVTSY